MTARPPLSVRLENVTVRYRGEPLFADLALTLEGGRWICLLGRSGTGKTTLLRFIAGLLPPDTASGRIVCHDTRPLAGRVAYMAQQDLLLPWLTVLQNVMLGSRLRGESAPETRARRLLAQLGLAGREQDRPRTLSGGMRQRVALARTLLENRPVTLMDEPFSSLDAITRYRLQELAARLLADRTTLLVTHDPLEALRLGHKIYVLTGSPARLDTPLQPPGDPPRSLDDTGLLALHGELLRRLAEGG